MLSNNLTADIVHLKYLDLSLGLFLVISSAIAILVAHASYGARLTISGNYLALTKDKTMLFLIRSPVSKGLTLSITPEPGLLGWQSTATGIFFSGLIGLGVAFENSSSLLMSYFFHYLHLSAAPIAVYFFYRGITNHLEQKIEPILFPKIVLLTVTFLLLNFLFANFASTPAGNIIVIILYLMNLILIPYIMIIIIKILKEEYLKHQTFIPQVSAMSISVIFYAFFTSFERIAEILSLWSLYVFSEPIKIISLSTTSTMILMYTFLTKSMKKRLDSTQEYYRFNDKNSI